MVNHSVLSRPSKFPFTSTNEVDANFARAEGEGELSLNDWREAHRNYFSRVLTKSGKEFSEDIPLVCERFRVIYT